MNPLFWFAFDQDADNFCVELDVWGNYLGYLWSECGCRLEACYALLAGPMPLLDDDLWSDECPF